MKPREEIEAHVRSKLEIKVPTTVKYKIEGSTRNHNLVNEVSLIGGHGSTYLVGQALEATHQLIYGIN